AGRRAAVVATRAGTGAANTLVMAGQPAETRAVDTGGVGDMPGGEVTAGTAENSGAAFLATGPPDIGTVVGGATVGGEAAGGEAASAGAAGAGAAGNGATIRGTGATIPGAGAASTGAAGGEVAATRAADPGA